MIPTPIIWSEKSNLKKWFQIECCFKSFSAFSLARVIKQGLLGCFAGRRVSVCETLLSRQMSEYSCRNRYERAVLAMVELGDRISRFILHAAMAAVLKTATRVFISDCSLPKLQE